MHSWQEAQIADGHMRWGHAGSAEGVAAQSGKGAHSTKDGNPYGLGWRIHESVEDTKLSTNKQHSLSGWLALGRGARGRGFSGQATFILVGRGVY